ncbi:hypothetical protein B0O99DRAFT_677424 [Bisporella sp. PMI_857]|nr:hypothetical protein B0O99DRAFT_677424 [Bisporella sp. PMI_857]
MDSQGFVPLCFVANFKRLQSLTQDIDVLRSTCMESDIIELRRDIDGVDHIRPKEGWEKMVLEMEQRDLSARNGGPRMGMWSEPCLCGIGEGERELVMKDNFDIHFGDFVLKIAKSRPPGAKKRSFSTKLPEMK